VDQEYEYGAWPPDTSARKVSVGLLGLEPLPWSMIVTVVSGLGLSLGDGLGLSLGDGLSVGPGAAGGSWTKTFDTVVDRAGPGRPWGPIPIHTVAPFTTCEYEISAQLADSE